MWLPVRNTEEESLRRDMSAMVMSMARLFGKGGATWTRERISGDGVNEDSDSETEEIEGYAVYTRNALLGGLLALGSAEEETWRFVCGLDEPIAIGDEITSIDAPEYKFRIGTITERFGYKVAELQVTQ